MRLQQASNCPKMSRKLPQLKGPGPDKLPELLAPASRELRFNFRKSHLFDVPTFQPCRHYSSMSDLAIYTN